MGRLDDIIARNRQNLPRDEQRALDRELHLSDEAKKVPQDTDYPWLKALALLILLSVSTLFYFRYR